MSILNRIMDDLDALNQDHRKATGIHISQRGWIRLHQECKAYMMIDLDVVTGEGGQRVYVHTFLHIPLHVRVHNNKLEYDTEEL